MLVGGSAVYFSKPVAMEQVELARGNGGRLLCTPPSAPGTHDAPVCTVGAPSSIRLTAGAGTDAGAGTLTMTGRGADAGSMQADTADFTASSIGLSVAGLVQEVPPTSTAGGASPSSPLLSVRPERVSVTVDSATVYSKSMTITNGGGSVPGTESDRVARI